MIDLDWRVWLVLISVLFTVAPGVLYIFEKFANSNRYLVRIVGVFFLLLYMMFANVPVGLAIQQIMDDQLLALKKGVPVSTEHLKSNREI